MSKGGKTYRNRRARLYDGAAGLCWYCGTLTWQPAAGQILDPKRRSRIAAETRASEDMATIEHQHDRAGLVVREVLSCMDCNSRKGTISGALNRVWISRIWEDRDDTGDGEGDVVQHASGEAGAGPVDANLHLH